MASEEPAIKITRAEGEGQGQCALCNKRGKWNVKWMTFLYHIDGMDGVYCRNCVDEIKRKGVSVYED